MTFYFYDLETSGVNPRQSRIMQFAGQRTDEHLQPIGQPHDLLIKLTPDILPDPGAILITGITPQQTQLDGLSEAEFLNIFATEIATPDTVFVGFNTVRFDDEFMRFALYRNFYDPYEWQWKDGRSRWDLLDVVRMTRALRPEGIVWPFGPDGRASNRLELLTAVNKLSHDNAHNALSDVSATIAVASMLKQKQPKLFKYLLNMRSKQAVVQLVESGQPFVYTSGKYSAAHEKTTVGISLGKHPQKTGALVYDLRYDPEPFAKLNPEQLADRWRWLPRDEAAASPRLPVKTLQYNRCPAVAPLATLDAASQKRLDIDLKIIKANAQKISQLQDWPGQLYEALKIMDKTRQEALFNNDSDVDSQLYEKFIPDADRNLLPQIRQTEPNALQNWSAKLTDSRLKALLPLYKARNFPGQLKDTERQAWDAYVAEQLMAGGESSRLAAYFASIEYAAKRPGITKRQQHILEDLRLYGESLM